jgi:hypothetical protein
MAKDPSGVDSKDRDLLSARPEPPDQPGAAKFISEAVAEGKKAQAAKPKDAPAPEPASRPVPDLTTPAPEAAKPRAR